MSERPYTAGTFRCDRCLDAGSVWASVVSAYVPCPKCAPRTAQAPDPTPKPLEELLALNVSDGYREWRASAVSIEMARRLRAVAYRHQEHTVEPFCIECGKPWPCPTTRALAGEIE